MPNEQTIEKLVGSAYEAASETGRWVSFLGRLATIAQADGSGLVMHDDRQGTHDVAASWEVNEEMMPQYREYYGRLDVWTARAKSSPIGRVCLSQELCRPDDLRKTEVYNGLMVPSHIEHGMFGLVERRGDNWAALSLYRSASSGEFNSSDLYILRLIVPHVQRAFKLHFQLAELRARSEGVEASLNMLSVGVVFLGASGEVLLMNRVAEEVFQRRDGLLVTRGEIGACLPSESTRLRAMTFGAAQTGSGRGLCAGGTMLISRDKQRPLSLTVAPLREFDPSLPQRPAAVIFISDPDRSAELPADLLSRSYGLTPAEARLATILFEGRSLKEAADLSGVTHNTAKSQLKSVFSKTQVQRQGQLIKLLLNSAGVVNPAKRAG